MFSHEVMFSPHDMKTTVKCLYGDSRSMLLSKTVSGRVVSLTNHKHRLLEKEHSAYSQYCNDVQECKKHDVWELLYDYNNLPHDLYSQTRKIAIRDAMKPKHHYNLTVYCQSARIQQQDTKLSSFWLKVPINKHHGGIWVALCVPKSQWTTLTEWKMKQVQLIKKGDNYIVRIMVQKEVDIRTSYSNILAIDMGEKVMATVCGSWNKKPVFYGKDIRGIRRHYAWLRVRLGERKCMRTLKKVGSKEQRKVDLILHEISKQIVGLAQQHDSLIVLGDLKGIRASARNKGRRMRRIVGNFPYHKFAAFIEYKAHEHGIGVLKINECNTSKTCSRCGQKGTRVNQGLFRCACGYEANADFNGAKNILERGLEHVSESGAYKVHALNSPIEVRSS